jgi:hypothetical protein
MSFLAHHLHAGGHNGEWIFRGDANRFVLFEMLEDEFGDDLLAFCFMSNHLHAVLAGLADAARRRLQAVLAEYTRRFNAEHGRSGKLFDWLKAQDAITTPAALAKTIHYVHANALDLPGIRRAVQWPWSTQRSFDGLSLARAAAVRRVEAGLGRDAWRVRSPLDESIGLTDAVAIPVPRYSLPLLLSAAAQVHLVPPADLPGKTRRPGVKDARALFLALAKLEGHSLTAAAKHLDRVPSWATPRLAGVPQLAIQIARTLIDTPTLSTHIVLAAGVPVVRYAEGR